MTVRANCYATQLLEQPVGQLSHQVLDRWIGLRVIAHTTKSLERRFTQEILAKCESAYAQATKKFRLQGRFSTGTLAR